MALLFAAALLPILVFAGVSAVRGLVHQRDAIEADALDRVRRLSDLVDRELAVQLDLVQSLAALPYFDPPADLARLDETLRRLFKQEPLWNAGLVAEPDGRIVVDTMLPVPGRVVDMESLRRVVETGAPLIGGVGVGQVSLGIPIRAPVIRNGGLTHVMTIVIKPDSIQRLLLESQVPPGWIGTVIDAHGRVVARSVGEASAIAKPASAAALAARAKGGGGLYDGLTLEGMAMVSAYWMSPQTGWSVHIAVPRAAFEAPYREALWFTLGGAGLALLLALVFAWLILRAFRARRAREREAEQTRRMESLGRLTGGVAHDFNNLLTVISGNSAMLERRLGDPVDRRRAEAIRRAVERGTGLTRQLLAFARVGTAPSSLFDVNERIRHTMGHLRQTLGSEIAIDLSLADGLPRIEADLMQFDLALMNLGLNARDAMPKGGRIRIVTAAGRPSGGRSSVVLSVGDTGGGISEELLQHAFEPFSSAAPAGKGTGFVLAQVYAFAQSAGGRAEIESALGRGTTVTLHLPAAEATSAGPQARAPAERAAVDGQKWVLVVDDNDDVRRVTADYLREQGFSVDEAETGDRAIRRLESTSYDAVVSDLVMPGEIDGIKLARRAQIAWPDLPVILVSGYSSAATEAHNEGFLVMLKPYDLEELTSEIMRHCDGNKPARPVAAGGL